MKTIPRSLELELTTKIQQRGIKESTLKFDGQIAWHERVFDGLDFVLSANNEVKISTYDSLTPTSYLKPQNKRFYLQRNT